MKAAFAASSTTWPAGPPPRGRLIRGVRTADRSGWPAQRTLPISPQSSVLSMSPRTDDTIDAPSDQDAELASHVAGVYAADWRRGTRRRAEDYLAEYPALVANAQSAVR